MDESPSADRLSDLATRYWRFQCHEFPLNAILAGEDVPDAVLFRESQEDYDRRDRAAGDMLRELETIVQDSLTRQDRLTYRLLREELEDLRSQHQVMAHLRPALLPMGPDYGTVLFANTATIGDARSAARYVERLASLPGYIRDVEGCLRSGHARGLRYPGVVLEAAIATVRSSMAGPVDELPWYAPFKRSAARGRDAVDRHGRQALELIRGELLPALADYAGLLEGPLSATARSSVACIDAPLGRDFYRAQVRHHTTTGMSPEAIHEIGQAEVARLDAEIEAVAAEAGFTGDVAGYRSFLANDPQFIAASKESLRETAESLCKRIDKRIPAFFGRIPRITYGVESMAESTSVHMPPAYAEPNPADGTAPGIFWMTGLPSRCPIYMLVPLALHEAWPGHLMHIALLQEMADLPEFRRHGALKYAGYIEGWALYCERLGAEMGLYETPHQQYGRLEMEMWRALRLVVDTGIHWFGWSRNRAIDTMMQRLAMPRGTIEAEVNRYVALPGQALAYQLGNLTIRSLRERAERALGENFNLRGFHDLLMAAGAVSLPLLEEFVSDALDL